MRVSDYIASFISDKASVKHIFMVSGGVAMHLNDAVALNKKIKYICNHHEQASVMAADAYSRITGKLGVCMVTAGPGSTNTITGLLNAWQDSIPIIIISGQSKSSQTIKKSQLPLRQFGVFEVDIIPVIKSLTKFSVMVTNPEKIRYYLEKAFYIAKSGRPGPVWIDVPLDVQGADIDPKKILAFERTELSQTHNKKKILNKKLEKVLDLLKLSRKPVILAGNGIRLSNAVEDFLILIKKLKIPVVTAINGTDVISTDNRFFVGRAGIKGDRGGNIALQNSDLIISIGSRLSLQVTGYEYAKFAPKAKKIVVDIDEVEHKKKTIKIDEFILNDAKEFIKELTNKIKKIEFNFKLDWSRKCRDIYLHYPVILPEYSKLKGSINMYYAVSKISEGLNSKDVLVTDAGFSYYIVRQSAKIVDGQRVIIPGATGTLGFNIPASIGASFARNKNRVICITGDGSFQTNIQELQTIVKHRLPIKIFVLENKGYVSISSTQRNFFDRLIGESEATGVSFPSISKIAYAYDIKYFRAKNNHELIKSIPDALKYKGPTIFEINCLPDQKLNPYVSSKRLSTGELVSPALDDMSPFLSDKEMDKIRSELL